MPEETADGSGGAASGAQGSAAVAGLSVAVDVPRKKAISFADQSKRAPSVSSGGASGVPAVDGQVSNRPYEDALAA